MYALSETHRETLVASAKEIARSAGAIKAKHTRSGKFKKGDPSQAEYNRLIELSGKLIAVLD